MHKQFCDYIIMMRKSMLDMTPIMVIFTPMANLMLVKSYNKQIITQS